MEFSKVKTLVSWASLVYTPCLQHFYFLFHLLCVLVKNVKRGGTERRKKCAIERGSKQEMGLRRFTWQKSRKWYKHLHSANTQPSHRYTAAHNVCAVGERAFCCTVKCKDHGTLIWCFHYCCYRHHRR